MSNSVARTVGKTLFALAPAGKVVYEAAVELVQARSVAVMLEQTIRRDQNRAVEAA